MDKAWSERIVTGRFTGNSSTTAGTNFIGTTDDVPFTIKVNNEVAGYIASPNNPPTFNNTIWGYHGLLSNTAPGKRNLAVGSQALMANTTGSQ